MFACLISFTQLPEFHVPAFIDWIRAVDSGTLTPHARKVLLAGEAAALVSELA